MNTFAIGDIHGGLKALKQLIERAGITKDSQIIFLGDYVDGWSDSAAVVDYLIELQQTHNCVFIRGNHDDLLYQYLKYNEAPEDWLIHGGSGTLQCYTGLAEGVKQKHITFLENLVNYYIDSDNRLFVHAGFTNLRGVHLEYFTPLLYWDRTLWELAVSLDPTLPTTAIIYPKRLTLYSEIFIGHTPVTRIGKTVPVGYNGVWNLDTGAGFLGSLSALCIENKNIFQSDPVHELYPKEKGRNV